VCAHKQGDGHFCVRAVAQREHARADEAHDANFAQGSEALVEVVINVGIDRGKHDEKDEKDSADTGEPVSQLKFQRGFGRGGTGGRSGKMGSATRGRDGRWANLSVAAGKSPGRSPAAGEGIPEEGGRRDDSAGVAFARPPIPGAERPAGE